jgi:competence protein ComEC
MSQIDEQSARSPFLAPALFLTLGIFLQRELDFDLKYLAISFLVFTVLTSLVFFRKTSAKSIFAFLLLSTFLLMGAIRLGWWKEKHLEKPFINYLPLQSVELQGSVRSVQHNHRIRAVFNLDKISRDSLQANTSGKILLYLPTDFGSEIRPGQSLTITDIDLEKLPEKRNPGQFDYANYLHFREIVAQAKIKKTEQITIGQHRINLSLENTLFVPLRSKLIKKIETHFSGSAADFLKALILGRRENLEDNILENFQNAGVMHVLAISGLHAGFVAIIFYIFLSFFPIYFKHRNLLVILLLIFYMFLTGNQPPVVRATLMASLLLIGLKFNFCGRIYHSDFPTPAIILGGISVFICGRFGNHLFLPKAGTA